MSGDLAAARSLLFVPGDRPDRFGKAVASGADAVILDLEDAVAPEHKERARDHVAAWLTGGGKAVVRVNGVGTRWFGSDLALAIACGAPVMLPKAEDPKVLEEIVTSGAHALLPLVETATGVARADVLCAVRGVVRLGFGSIDLAAQLGVRHDDIVALRHAQSCLVLASAAADVAAPLDGVTVNIADARRLDRDIRNARRMGFGGKLCVHPRQVAAVQAGFAPTEAELSWARRIVAAEGAVTMVDGQMVDRPVRERAERVLRAAR